MLAHADTCGSPWEPAQGHRPRRAPRGRRLLPAAIGAFLALAGTATVLPPPTASAATAAWRPDLRAASAFADDRAGTTRISIRTSGGAALGLREYARAPSASLVKAMLLVGWLRRAADRPLTAGDRRLLDPMVRRSDDVTATVLRDRLGQGALVRLSRAFGMRRFEERPVWGLSRSSPADQTRFFLRIDRLMPARHRAYGMRLLATVVAAQRWGIGRVALPAGWRLYFKGGWGSGTGAVEHQSVLLVRGNRRVALSVMIAGSPSHGYGKETLRGTFVRLLHGLR
ncbi:hypothetical protein DSM112329_02787 [Paraconexibacter sp. AEG42_29]|uniref:Beta-lactamase class A catalytic domain-containing protein n=1 Tax=Paraconexibacter sp. AEG42_29 TaxID=2997339 RepID=A0AAU7AW92_9ACTN